MKRSGIIFTAFLVLLQFCCRSLWARPTTAHQAQKVVAGWLKADAQPLGASLGQQVMNVETFTDDNGEPVYYIIYLQPCGFVIVPADDLIEPIIGFADDGTYDPSDKNPLGALVTNDLKGRIAAVRAIQRPQVRVEKASALDPQSKWNLFISLAEASEGSPALLGLTSISDVRVAPLLQSKWWQRTCCTSPSLACYNYYTPRWVSGKVVWDEGNKDNYPSGCVATAMAQLMRYHQHPTSPIGEHDFTIKVSGNSTTASTRGGDGSGGAYSWNQMVLVPGCTILIAQRKAIGALCYDAGVAVSNLVPNTYTNYKSDDTIAYTRNAKTALTTTFKYGNAVKGYNSGGNIGSGLIGMLNPNLDAKDPVILGITGAGGHAVVCDGYGYNSSTMYHHCNLGWGGSDDAWYNLPLIQTSQGTYTSVYKSVYNIHVSGTYDGEVISGRVFDTNGQPFDNANVCAEDGGEFHWTSTGSGNNGIYAFPTLSSATTYTIDVLKDGYVFETQTIATGTSVDNANTSGNVWGIDFYAQPLEITSITPASGPRGTYTKIEGQNFGSSPGKVAFSCFFGIPWGEEVQWSDTVVYCRVPDCTLSGLVKIVTANDSVSTGKYFEVTDPNQIIVDIANYTPNIENGTTQYPFSKIQRGIRAASTDNTVIVKQGTYYENIDFSGKSITVTSMDPLDLSVVAATIIDGNQIDTAVTFENGEDANCLLTGFTIVDGNAESGGGIYCKQSNPVISYCTITGNAADHWGGGMYTDAAHPTLVNCTFRGNSVGWFGGGLYNYRSSNPALANCTFVGNSAGSTGGAMVNAWASSPMLTNCTISGNLSGDGGGVFNTWDSNPVLANCILWANSDNGGTDESAQIQGGIPTINYTCIQGWTNTLGGTGNIGDDPNFVRESNDSGDGWGVGDNDDFGDLHLLPGSPCIDAGDNTAVPADTADLDSDANTTEPTPWDIDRHPRFLDDPLTTDTGNGTRPLVDMGVDEFGSLIAHWKLDEASGTTAEDSIGTNDGTLYGAPTWQPFGGRFEGALLLDGDGDYVSTPNESNFDLTDAITVSVWIKANAIDKDWQAIITKGDSAWRFSTVWSEGRIQFALTSGPPWNYINGDTQIQTGQWHHVCGTYDGTNIRLYIDGLEDPASPAAYNGGIGTNNYKVLIGENAEMSEREWNGLLDDVRVYNYALSADDIFRLFCPEPSISDLNLDCMADLIDFAILADQWLQPPAEPSADIAPDNPDGIVDFKDLAVFVDDWLAGL